MLWGTFLWAFLHLLSIGNLAALILFAGIGGFAITKIFLIGDKKTAELGKRMPVSKDIVVVLVGLVDYALLLYFHSYLSGIELIQ